MKKHSFFKVLGFPCLLSPYLLKSKKKKIHYGNEIVEGPKDDEKRPQRGKQQLYLCSWLPGLSEAKIIFYSSPPSFQSKNHILVLFI